MHFFKILITIFIFLNTSFSSTEAPSTIYVGTGYFGGEQYDFFSDAAGNNPINIGDYTFYEGSTYTFERIGYNNHPFYISDIQFNGSYHLGDLSFSLQTTASISRYHGIQAGESFTFTVPNNYTNSLHYYCTIAGHSTMVGSLSTSEAPTYLVSSRLIITEVKRSVDQIEVTNFSTDSGILEQDTTITNILGDSVLLSANTSFNAGETKIFSTSLNGTEHLMLIALDAANPEYWVDGSSYNNLGLFYAEQSLTNHVDDVVQGDIRIGLQTVVSGLSHPIGLVDPNDGTERKFIFEQTGEVRVLNSNGSLESEPFMTVTNNLIPLVLDTVGYDERGLLGLVLDPDFSSNGKLYFYASVNTNGTPDYAFSGDVLIDHHSVIIERIYTNTNGNNYFDGLDSYTERELLRFEQPVASSFPFIGSNHNGGHLAIDNDGNLLVSIGDGGDRDDTGNGHGLIGNGADPSNIWGSIIRIDPNGSNSINGAYGIPVDNPFLGSLTQTEAPSTIYVGTGYFGGEQYDFFSDAAGNNPINIGDYTFYEGSTYTFERIGYNNHPFYISDIQFNGSYHLGDLSFSLQTTASISRYHGIQAGESFTFTVPNNYTNSLHYYCTIAGHSTMVGSLNTAESPKLPEIFAYGLRNPWTFSQDPVSGVIYTSDSGQDTIQEVNIVTSGGNYGWRAKEGSYLFDPVSGSVATLSNAPSINGLIDPIAEYDHGQGYANVIGGHVYRGSLISELQGFYVCGDYGQIFGNSGELFYLDIEESTPQLKRFLIGANDRPLITDVRGFSIDAAGEIYFVGNGLTNNSLFKIVPIAHMTMSINDNVEISVIGDEESTVSLINATTIEGLSNGSTNIMSPNGSEFIFPIQNKSFFKVIAE